MKIHHKLTELPEFKNSIVTIGTFDGVHQGHKVILNQLLLKAQQIGGETVVVTFHPHPRQVLKKDVNLRLLNSLQEKTELLAAVGIDHLIVVNFDEAFAKLTAQQYVEQFIIKQLKPHTLIIGYDHHFGNNRDGNYRLLEQYANQGSFNLIEIPSHTIDAIAVSSTKIREAISSGNIAKANELLGYNYFVTGVVVKGNQLGRTIGYPTANIRVYENTKMLPTLGVYSVGVEVKGLHYFGMMNIGYRPSVNGTTLTIEVNIFNFDEDIYDETIKVAAIRYLRSEKKFNGLNELKEQLALDKIEASKDAVE
jgi:riboflavin kinase / FMN adenylyltransferase